MFLRAQDGQLLRDDRLVDAEGVLELLDRPLAARERLEDADADRVGEGPEELGLERLQLGDGHLR